MTKRWSSTRSDLTKTKRQASKEMRRKLRKEVLEPLGNVLCDLGDDPEAQAEMEKDFARWNSSR